MRSAFFLTIVVASAPFVAYNQESYWVEVNNGPQGSRVVSLETTSTNFILAGTWEGNIYRSTDDGSLWTKITNTPFASPLFFLYEYEATIIGGAQDGLYLSLDEGDTWMALSLDVSPYVPSSVTSTLPGSLFVSTNGRGVYHSSDGGASWSQRSQGLSDSVVSTIASISTGRVFAGTTSDFLLGTSSAVYRTTNDGLSWDDVTPPLMDDSDVVTAMGASPEDHIFVATLISSDVFRTTDGGDSWEGIDDGIPNSTHVSSFVFGASGLVFAGTDDGIYRSTDNGNSWEVVNNGIGITSLVRGDAFVLAGDYAGTLYKTTDDGVSWNLPNLGLRNTHVSGVIAADDDAIWVGTNGGGVFKTSDNGTTWLGKSNGLDWDVFSLSQSVSGSFFAGTELVGVFRSTNYGDSWEALNTGIVSDPVNAITSNSSGHVFAATRSGSAFRSVDNGLTWTEQSSGLLGFTIHSISVTNSDFLFAATRGGVFRSTDNGENWTLQNEGLTDTVALSVSASLEGLVLVGTLEDGLFGSTDDGATWTRSGKGTVTDPVTAFGLNNDGTLFAGTFSGVYTSSDQGQSWTELPGTVTSSTSIGVSGSGFVFVGTFDSGVYRSIQTTTGVEEEEVGLPGLIALSQNYPNPFNPSTTIRFSIPKSAEVNLRIFNLLGEEVATLVSGHRDAGTHTVQWDATGQPSGVFFCRLRAGEFVETRKLVLLR